MRHLKAALVGLTAVVLLTETVSAQTQTYEAVSIDADGNLAILTSARKTVIVPKGGFSKAGETFGRQTAFEKPVLSDDRRAVGAQAMFGNCCTSYDIPLQLVIYSDGTTHRFEGRLAIFDWHFVDGGRRVAFSQQTVHSACAVHWELRDIASERLLAQVDIPQECGPAPMLPKVTVPTWVTGTSWHKTRARSGPSSTDEKLHNSATPQLRNQRPTPQLPKNSTEESWTCEVAALSREL